MPPVTVDILKFFKSLIKYDMFSGRRDQIWSMSISNNLPSAEEIYTSLASVSSNGIVSIAKAYDLVDFSADDSEVRFDLDRPPIAEVVLRRHDCSSPPPQIGYVFRDRDRDWLRN